MPEQATTTTTATAPAPTPAPTKTPREQAVEIVAKAKATDTEPAKPASEAPKDPKAETKTEPEKKDGDKAELPKLEQPKDETRTAAEIAVIARENRKILAEKESLKADKESVKKEREAIEARKAELAIVDKLKAGDYVGALDALDPKWYETAVKQQIAKQKPGSPEALQLAFNAEISSLKKEIEELKKPKSETTAEEPEDKPVAPEVIAERLRAFKTSVTEHVKTLDAFKGELNGKPITPEAVTEEVVNWVDGVITQRQQAAAARGKRYVATQDDVNQLTTEGLEQLAAIVVEKRKLASAQPSNETRDATARKSDESGAPGPQPITTRQTTITESLHDAVPVSAGPQTSEQRRQAAIELVRRAKREAET